MGSLGFASHGSQGLEIIYRFPQSVDHWIDAWIEQCDFGVTPQVLDSPLNIYEDRGSCDETDAPYASEGRSPEYDQANLDASSNEELVHLKSLKGTSNMMERLLAKRTSDPPRPDLQSAMGPDYSSSAASATYANDAYLNASSGYVSAADSGHYSSAASMAGSKASSAGSYVSLAGSHASLASSQSNRKGKRKAPDLELRSRAAPEGKPFQCTWCFKEFPRPQEWNRHEGSVHFELKELECMPNGSAEPSFPFVRFEVVYSVVVMTLVLTI